ncbi:MAG TPA: sigma-70 family RNA polymerase sigma factor, partial [Thermoanaerobaculia bacterium]
LFGVIRRTASEERRRAALGRILFGTERLEASPAAPSSTVSVEHLAMRSAVERLPRRQREVLQLVLAMGMTLREVSETLSISPGAASVHYDRGKRRLKALLALGQDA